MSSFRKSDLVLLAGYAVLALFLCYYTARLAHPQSIFYNEGWNAFGATRVASGGPLYPKQGVMPLLGVNYPPLSFVAIAALARLGIDVLYAGRIISLASFLVVGWLIYGIVFLRTHDRRAAAIATLVFALIMCVSADAYVGTNDPQMLAHSFAMTALLLFCRWEDCLTTRRIAWLALLCATSLFTKHLLLPVPIVIAVLILRRDRRRGGQFLLAGALIGGVGLLATFAWAGPDLFANFLELSRQASNHRLLVVLEKVFARAGFLFLPFLLALRERPRQWEFAWILFLLAFGIGAAASRGAGVAMNAWFDLAIAAALLFGWLAARAPRWRPAMVAPLLIAAFVAGIPLRAQYRKLARDAATFRSDVARLSAIPGPALFSDMLLGFRAGKSLECDPFLSSQIIEARKVPASLVVDPIRQHRFGAIVLVGRASALYDDEQDDPQIEYPNYWHPRILDAVKEHYTGEDPSGSSIFFLPRLIGAR